jgi:hypoxanthine-DNA glycosylase
MADQRMTKQLARFPPVIDAGVEILMLGSFPGEMSLAKAQYYGHPRNQFWKLMGTVLKLPLQDMEYDERLQALLSRKIGLWDVVAGCEREGSLDTAIRNARPNDFAATLRIARRLRRVCFNGKFSGRLEPWFAARGYQTVVLPSSSPANAVHFDVKLKAWRAILKTTNRGVVPAGV